MGYPKFKYHKDFLDGKIVKDESEEKALGLGWVESPADVEKAVAPSMSTGVVRRKAVKGANKNGKGSNK